MFRSIALATLFATATLVSSQSPPAKRALKHSDYEIWNSATGMTLAPDGQWIAYSQMPGEGDGTFIVKSLSGATSYSFVQGSRSSGTPAAEGAPSPSPFGPLAGSPVFSPDGKRVFVPLVPSKAEADKARNEKKSVRTVLASIDLPTGKVVERIEKLKAFSVIEKSNYLVLHREEIRVDPGVVGSVVGGFSFAQGASSAPAPGAGTQAPGSGRRFGPGQRPGGVGPGGQPPGAAPAGSPAAGTPATPAPSAPTGSDLIIRSLADGKEQTIAAVTDYSVSRDGKLLLVTRVSKKDADNGLFAVELGSPTLNVIKTGNGKISRETWDEKQLRLAFFHEEPAPDTKPNEPKPVVKPRIMLWERNSKAPAFELLNGNVPGLATDMMIVERGGLRFSEDGLKLAVGTAKIPDPRQSPATPPTVATESINLDLWHWKDERIQPMQKVRNESPATRSFSAVYFFDSKQFRQLSDENLTVPIPDHGDWAVAANDKPYRNLTGYGPTLSDYSLVNIRTGEKKPYLTAHEGFLASSPKGKYRATFDGKDWICLAVPEGKPVNLTAKLPVKFFNEQFDLPMKPSAYGIVGWTPDEKSLLVTDQYDIWKLSPDGSAAENLTKIGRGSKLKFEIVTFPDPDGAPQRGIDLSKSLLLKATNLATYDSGFYRMEPGGQPKLIVMGNREYGRPIKARRVDTVIFTVSTFSTYPDYYVSDLSFKEIRRVTDINPRVREFNWGKAELVNYKSADGVELSGMLIKPEDFDPQKKYPMIVYIYERLSDDLHRFRMPSAGTSINPTYYASNGYLVYMPDIAYTVGSPGQSAMKCVLPAIQAVVEKGFVNEAAIGIQGHSWGGYQIAYMVTQTNRFKAAVSGAPVSNMVSAYGGIRWGSGLPRQFQYERTQSRIGKTLWDAPMKYIENSPIFMADRVQTPLMILHNDQDDAVPWYQGIEYYLALRRLGKECYLLNYNGEFHGLRKKATQRDYTLRMQQFFDHHLKGAPMPEWMSKGIPFAEREKEKDQWKPLFKPEKK